MKPPYHHGALAPALLTAAEALLERDGIAGLTLRAAARAAGVSHAAPTHHFGDLTGLLSELAAIGYRRFRQRLLDAMAASGPDGPARMVAMGTAYVEFARASPNLFLLMFRGDRLDHERPALQQAARDAFSALEGAVGEATEQPRPGLDGLANAMAAWSLVHGFAVLMIDGRLPREVLMETLLSAVLTRLALR